MPRKQKLAPLADERRQLRRWIASNDGGQHVYGVRSNFKPGPHQQFGLDLGEPWEDEAPPIPASYWRGRKGPPEP
jgi:hypothetical protein